MEDFELVVAQRLVFRATDMTAANRIAAKLQDARHDAGHQAVDDTVNLRCHTDLAVVTKAGTVQTADMALKGLMPKLWWLVDLALWFVAALVLYQGVVTNTLGPVTWVLALFALVFLTPKVLRR